MLHWRPLLPPLFCNSSLRSALNAYNFSALPQRNQIQLLCWCTSRSLTPFPRLETLLKTHSTLSIFHAYISNFPGDDTGIISLVKMGHDPLWPFDSDSMDCFIICDSSDCLVRPPICSKWRSGDTKRHILEICWQGAVWSDVKNKSVLQLLSSNSYS